MMNAENRMSNELRNPNVKGTSHFDIRHSGFDIHSSFVIRHSPSLLFCILAMSASALPAAEPPAAAAQRHASPQAAFDAFCSAAEKKDWPVAIRCCATRLQNHLLVSNLRIGYRIAESVPEHKEGFEALLRRHIPRLDEWKQQLRAKAKAESRDPLVADLANMIRDGAADKPALLADLFAWVTKQGIDHGLAADAVVASELRNLTIDGQQAKGIAVTGDEQGVVEFPVQFIQEPDGWRLMLPEL